MALAKIASLRALLLRAVPSLAAAPERLAIFVDRGRIAARASATGSLSFEYRFTLHLVVQDYAGDWDALIVPLLGWVARYQLELLEGPNDAPIAFEAELLDADSCDLSLTLELSEAVVVTCDEGGGYAARHLADDRDRDDHFPDTCGARLWSLVLGDELVAAKAAP
ncbi:phage tail protein [Sphingomonas sp. BK069]|uniref:phage tail protein n=1 Tax=Sphingomonas sp. BK069 TaxID=2586979 RepID=UPI00182259BA|nr:phage tail protein [Sphingomonas sp. BK069]MBB3346057.1 hypothetical protein [Sphingomonas sp. BK069]